MARIREKWLKRRRRRVRTRRKVMGTPERPRLSVYRSLHHIHGQIIDDMKGVTLVACSSLSSDVRDEIKGGGNKAAAAAVGRKLAGKAIAAGVRKVVFDKGSYKFHGRVKAFADAAREAGLKF